MAARMLAKLETKCWEKLEAATDLQPYQKEAYKQLICEQNLAFLRRIAHSDLAEEADKIFDLYRVETGRFSRHKCQGIEDKKA